MHDGRRTWHPAFGRSTPARTSRLTPLRTLRLRPLRALLPAALLGACETSVVSVAEVAEVEVSPAHITLVEGSRQTASATVRESGGTVLSGRTVTWTAEDPDVATVTPEGIVEGRAPGSTRIHASSEGVRGSADVTVLSGPAVRLSPETVELVASSGDAPVTREIAVVNTGNGSLGELSVRVRGSGGDPASWLEAELLGTTTPTQVRLRARAERLDEGSHEAFVTVESSAAPNADATAIVRLTVVAAPEPGPACDIRNHVFEDDFEVPRNTSCVFTNVHVRGKLTLREGARLTASDLRVDEALESKGAGEVVLTEARIGGDVKLEKGGSVTIEGSDLGKKLELKSNRGSIELRDNTIEDDVKLEDNDGGPFLLLRNAIDGKLECKGNEPAPTGSGNAVDDETVGQCRSL